MKLDYALGPQIGAQARLGLIALQTDERIEADFRAVLPRGDEVAGFVSRIASGAEVTRAALAQMEQDLGRAASLLPPSLTFDVIGYGCTSASSVIGAQAVAQHVKVGCKTEHVTNPMTALIAASQYLGVQKLAVLTPYVRDVTDGLVHAIHTHGLEACVIGAYEESSEAMVARIDSSSTFEAARSLGADDAAEAVFLSCTNLNTFGIIEPLEQALGKPVFSSNQVLFWHMAHLAGLSLDGPGEIFENDVKTTG